MYVVCERCGFGIDVEWKDGALTVGRIRATIGGTCCAAPGKPIKIMLKGKQVKVREPEKNVLVFEARAGQAYVIGG